MSGRAREARREDPALEGLRCEEQTGPQNNGWPSVQVYGLLKLLSFEGMGPAETKAFVQGNENGEEHEPQRHRTQRAGNPDGDEQSGGRDGHGTTEKGGAGSPLPRRGLALTRHLLEMVLAMFAGMGLLGVALWMLGEPPGYSNLLVKYGLMGAFMAAPMVAWMRHRGHSWADGLEMTAAMLAPMFALVIPMELGVAGYVPGLSEHSLVMLSHVGMIGGMVALIIYRFERYAHSTHGVARSAPTTSQGEITHEASE